MLGKVITLNKGSRSRGFGPVLRYLFRDGPDHGPESTRTPIEGGVLNLDAAWATPEDRWLLAQLLDTTARRSTRFRGNPVYHVALSWPAGEHPTTPEIRSSVTHLMTSVQMTDCEAVYAVHRDTLHDHVHCVINRIHPEKGTVAGPPQFDYFRIDRACRELELQHGWSHDPGPSVVDVSPAGIPTVRRRTAAESRAWAQSRGPSVSPLAHRAARNRGIPSFQAWLASGPGEALRSVLCHPGASWARVHEALAPYGVALIPGPHGLRATTRLPEGRRLTAKAAHLGLTSSTLTPRLGPWVGPERPLPEPSEEHTYAACTARTRRGADADHAGRDSQRALRRAERATARQALYDRFQTEQAEGQGVRRRARLERTARHRQERQRLKTDLAARRVTFRATQQTAGVPPMIVRALWAFEAAQAREALQRRQAAERRASGTVPKGSVWRQWLTAQAGQGDAAAQATLRGLHYQEQRQRSKGRNGLEGEDLDLLKPLLPSLHTEVDRHRQRVHYRDDAGQLLFTDTGPRIEVHDRTDTTLEAALRIAAQKFGGSVSITGTDDFRAQATRTAARLGIAVRDADLQPLWQDARQRGMEPRRPAPSPRPAREWDPGMER